MEIARPPPSSSIHGLRHEEQVAIRGFLHVDNACAPLTSMAAGNRHAASAVISAVCGNRKRRLLRRFRPIKDTFVCMIGLPVVTAIRVRQAGAGTPPCVP